MSSLLNQLAIDAVSTFLTDFAETITYTPWQGAPIQIQAVIQRNVPSEIQGLPGASAYKHEIMIANDPTAGVAAINKSKDEVSFSNRVGEAAETFTVLQIIQNDQGIWHLGVG
jgi:hypothetical protein